MRRVGNAPIRPAWPAEALPDKASTSSAAAGLLSPTPELAIVETHWLPSPAMPSADDLDALRRAMNSRGAMSSRDADDPRPGVGARPADGPATPASASDPVARMLDSIAVLLELYDEVHVRRVGGGKG